MTERQRSFGESRRRGLGHGSLPKPLGRMDRRHLCGSGSPLGRTELGGAVGSGRATHVHGIACVLVVCHRLDCHRAKSLALVRCARGEIEIDMEYDEDRHTYRRKTVFRYTDAPAERVRKARERVASAASRIEAMERYVTSRQYDLNREFAKL